MLTWFLVDIKRPNRYNKLWETETPAEPTRQHVVRSFLYKHKKVIVISSIAVFALAICLTIALSMMPHRDSPITMPSASDMDSSQPSGDPQFATIVPDGKTDEDLGGWERVSPPESAPVYAYTDKIDDVTLIVSQQPLPESFENNVTGNVADVAKKFYATTELKAGDTKFYLGTSAKGPQSVIFTKYSLLILIKSDAVLSNDTWSKYVESLNNPAERYMPKY